MKRSSLSTRKLCIHPPNMADEEILDATGDSKREDKSEKINKLPITRVKTIMKMDPDVCLASQESVFLIARATELFIQEIAKEAYLFTSQNKKKTLHKKDVDSSINAVDCFVFLEGTLD